LLPVGRITQLNGYLVVAHGTSDEVSKAKSILETTGAAKVATHQADGSPVGSATAERTL
jgi:hypothetical protein